MPDYGRELRFGYFLVPDASAPLLDTAREVERRGLDYIAIQDHPYQRRFVDAWVLMSMIAATTSRISVFPDVANLPLRPPAVMAKAAASLDVLSGGRFELGLGAGAFWDAIEAYGGPRRAPAEALAALTEAIEVIRKVWSGERNLRSEGRHYRLAGAHSGSGARASDRHLVRGVRPARPAACRAGGRRVGAVVPGRAGARSFRWRPGSTSAAADAGRDPGQIRRLLNVGGAITDGASDGMFRGPVQQWADELAQLVQHGFDTFVFGGEPPSWPGSPRKSYPQPGNSSRENAAASQLDASAIPISRAAGIVRSLVMYYGPVWRRRRMEAFYRQFLSPGDLAFDIGSHVGNRVRRSAGSVPGWWRSNHSLTSLALLRFFYGRDPGVTLEACGLAAESGQGELHLSTRTPTVSTFANSWIGEVQADRRFRRLRWDTVVKVPLVTLEELIARHGEPQFCKIDVEGFELDGLLADPRLSFEYIPVSAARAIACVERTSSRRLPIPLLQGRTHRWAVGAWLDAEAMIEVLSPATP